MSIGHRGLRGKNSDSPLVNKKKVVENYGNGKHLRISLLEHKVME